VPSPRTSIARKRPRQQRAQATVEAILDAAARILEAEGIERFNTNRVAERAGVSVGSLYQYFPNKQARVRALIERAMRGAEAVRPPELAAESAAALEQGIAAAVAWHLRVHGGRPTLHKRLQLLAREVLAPGELEGFERAHEAAVRRFLQRHRDSLRIRDIDIAAFLVSRLLQGAPDRALFHHAEALEDGRLAAELTDLILRYLKG
jgi:AcrR family transcriptional regulator